MKTLAVVGLLAITWIRPSFGQSTRPLAVDESMAKDIQRENKNLKTNLNEFHQGKRNYRDGYFILRRLYENNHILRQGHTPEAREIEREYESLKAQHPDLVNNPPERLSEENAAAKASEDAARLVKERAAKFVPPDDHPVRLIGTGKNVVARHQFKLLFYKLPEDAVLKQNSSNALGVFRDGKEVRASEMHPVKTMTFKRAFMTPPDMRDEVTKNILACTTFWVSEYQGMTDDERELVKLRGGGTSMRWTNPTGERDQLCGVVSLTGNIVYEFPVVQAPPQTILFPLGIDASGDRAAVAVGSVVTIDGEDGRYQYFGKPREILLWRAAKGLKRIPVKGLSDDDLRREFFYGKLIDR